MAYHKELLELDIQVRYSHRGDVKVPCPKCSQSRRKKTDPCLSVNVDTGLFKCHHCDYSGTAAKREKPDYGYEHEYIKTYTRPISELKVLSQPLIDWFKRERGIDNQTLLRWKVTESLETMPQSPEQKRNAINFNYFDISGELVNIKYRDGQKNFKMAAGAMLIPYGLHVAFDTVDDFILLTEGEIDALSWWQAGITQVLSVPNGAPPVPKDKAYNPRLDWLDENWHVFEGVKHIYIAMDADQPGFMLREELARRFGKERCFIVEYPEGCKDANQVLVELGTDSLRDCFGTAQPYPVDGIEDAGTEEAALMYLLENGLPEGDRTGYNEMDELFTWHRGMVTLVTGIPGHGKTSWIKQVLCKLAERHSWKSLIYSAEEASTAHALTDLFAILSGKTFFKSKGGMAPQVTKADIEKWKPFVKEHFKYIKLDDVNATMTYVLQKAKEMVYRQGINCLVIDNMSMVEGVLPKAGESRHNAVGDLMTQVSKASRLLGLHIILVAHPKKMEKADGQYKIPDGYDVGDSSHYFNKPDLGITVYRNYETRQSDIICWKARFRFVGTTGKASLTYDRDNGRFYDGVNYNTGAGASPAAFRGQPIQAADTERYSHI